jgi:WD40 repeat protein
MRLSKIPWILHGNLPINSIDVQPNGYRFVTVGNDGKAFIWNLLPVISAKKEGKSKTNNVEEESKSLSEGKTAYQIQVSYLISF